MIPVKEKITEVDSLPGEEVEFTIGNAYWVMKSLSKLYSNPILATVREYSTNARDANDEAGAEDVAIKVTLPSLYHPYFEVEDFGVGMSEAELKTTYTQFGTSTKRDNPKANGMLGFGSKSALAYTDTFTVTSRKDGIQTVAVVSRKADFSRVTLKVVAVSKTTEPNGTKIQVPSRDYDAFNRIAMDFYRFWVPGMVEVDGKYPEWYVGEKLDDNLYYSKKEGTSYVVMGKVAYRIANPDALFQNRGMRTISFVAYQDVCNCDDIVDDDGNNYPHAPFEFVPSREDLEYTEHTKKNLHKVIDDFEKKMVVRANAEIMAAKDYFDAYSKYMYWTGKLGKGPFGDLEFKGEKFVDSIKFEGFRYRPSETRYNMYSINSWSVSQMNDAIIVTGMPQGNPSSHHKSRAKKWRDMKGIRAPYILFTSAQSVTSVWIDSARVVSWDVVKELTKPPKLPRDPNAVRPKRIKGTFDFYSDGGKWNYEKEIPDTGDLYYITVNTNKQYRVSSVLNLTGDKDAVVVILAANRVAKFTRENPKVKEFSAEFKKRVELDGNKFIDKQTREVLSVGNATRKWIDKFDVDKVLDPEFKRIKTLLATDSNDGLKAYQDAFALAQALGMQYNFKQHDISRDDDSLLDKYPLLKKVNPAYTHVNSQDMQEYTFYVNAKYEAARKAAKKGK